MTRPSKAERQANAQRLRRPAPRGRQGPLPKLGAHLRAGGLGTLCGATYYTAQRLIASGVKVRHESMGEDGTVDGLWTLPLELRADRDRRRPLPTDYTWDALFVVVRPPFRYAVSAAAMARRGYEDLSWWCDDAVALALRYWVLCMEHASELTDVVLRADGHHYEADYRDLCGMLGVPVSDPDQARNPKARRVPPWTWEDWYRQDADFAARGQALVKRFDLKEE